ELCYKLTMQKRQNHALSVFLLAVLTAACLNAATAPPAASIPAEAVASLSPSRYFEDVKYLSSDDLKGRASGSPELEKAADYIAAQFLTAGLCPMGDGNSFFQKFEITTGAKLGANNDLQLNGTKLKINDDFVPILFSSSAKFDGP